MRCWYLVWVTVDDEEEARQGGRLSGFGCDTADAADEGVSLVMMRPVMKPLLMMLLLVTKMLMRALAMTL